MPHWPIGTAWNGCCPAVFLALDILNYKKKYYLCCLEFIAKHFFYTFFIFFGLSGRCLYPWYKMLCLILHISVVWDKSEWMGGRATHYCDSIFFVYLHPFWGSSLTPKNVIFYTSIPKTLVIQWHRLWYEICNNLGRKY